MRLHYFKHVPFEGLGSIEKWADGRTETITATRFYNGDMPPSTDAFDWLVIMGGPMNIYEEDRYPWLSIEKRCIRDAINRRKTVLGVCLGAQLIADALGSMVYPNEYKEIGWFPIKKHAAIENNLPFPDEIEVFHWHGDTFDLPPKSIRLAQSEACKNQAFIYGDRVVGLQFHLELTKEGVGDLIQNCAHELVEGPYIQAPQAMLSCDFRFHQTNLIMERLLERLKSC